jgi:hypothetical protein
MMSDVSAMEERRWKMISKMRRRMAVYVLNKCQTSDRQNFVIKEMVEKNKCHPEMQHAN